MFYEIGYFFHNSGMSVVIGSFLLIFRVILYFEGYKYLSKCYSNIPQQYYHSQSMLRSGLPPPPQDMTTDEMEIALSYLKKRFNEYSLDQVMLSLIQHLENHPSQTQNPINEVRIQGPQYSEDPALQMRRTRITHHNRDQRELRQNISSISVNNEQKLKQLEQIRLVAKFFCQTGINVRLVQHFFPDMTPQRYRSYIDKINGQAINDIQKFLRYECNIQIEHLCTEQKRSLREKLMKVREWLGQKSVSQLDTYYSFIQRHYEQKQIDIRYDQALKLYKTFLELIKSPFVDVMEVIGQDQDLELRPPQTRTNSRFHTAPVETFTHEEKQRVIQKFLKEGGNYEKTNATLNETWGYSIKWSVNSLKAVVKHAVKKSIRKTILSRDKYLPRGTQIMFGDSQEQIKSIIESRNAEQIRKKLLKFYIANKVTVTDLTNLIKELNIFFTHHENSQQINLSSDSSVNIIPKLQFDAKIETHQSRHQIEPQIIAPEAERPKQEQTEPQQPQYDEQRQRDNKEDKMTEATQQEIKHEPEIHPPQGQVQGQELDFD